MLTTFSFTSLIFYDSIKTILFRLDNRIFKEERKIISRQKGIKFCHRNPSYKKVNLSTKKCSNFHRLMSTKQNSKIQKFFSQSLFIQKYFFPSTFPYSNRKGKILSSVSLIVTLISMILISGLFWKRKKISL